MNALYRTAEALGVEIVYDAEVAGSRRSRTAGSSRPAVALDGATHEVRANALVAAAGGFEANIPWLKQYWGDVADNFIVRGTPYNQGRVLRALLDRGASRSAIRRSATPSRSTGARPGSTAASSPALDCVPFGIVVNQDGRRFYDEGEDFWPKRYAIWGRLVAQQPGQIGHVIIDRKAAGKFMPSVFPPMQARHDPRARRQARRSIRTRSRTTVARFNAAVRPGTFDRTALDDCRTEGLEPPKSHWALPLDTPPFSAYPLRPGHHLHLSRRRGGRTRAGAHGRRPACRRTSSPPARSWPATCSARAISPASA